MGDLISTMNDSKWCRLLNAIADVPLPVSCWRFLDDDREYTMPTPSIGLVMEHNGRRGIKDCSVVGPFFFRDVRHVRWPGSWSRNWFRGYEPVTEYQPIEELSSAIEACGKFDCVKDENGLTLFAWRTP